MRLVKLFWISALFVGFGVFLLAMGYVSLAFFINDGIERFTEEERAAAQDALLDAWIGCFDNPLIRVFPWRMRVVEVQFKPECCQRPDRFGASDYLVTLRVHTFFGIPTRTISVGCGSVTCYEWVRANELQQCREKQGIIEFNE